MTFAIALKVNPAAIGRKDRRYRSGIVGAMLAERELALRRAQQQHNSGLRLASAGAHKYGRVSVGSEGGELTGSSYTPLFSAFERNFVNLRKGNAGVRDTAKEQ